MRSVYVETSIVSYVAARPSRDSLVAAHQLVSRRWWNEHRKHFDLRISEVVLAAGHRHRSRTAGDLAMWKDPIVEEIHRVRAAYAKSLGNDLKRIVADLRARELARSKAKSRTKNGRAKKRAA